jgi:hypothetical protein
LGKKLVTYKQIKDLKPEDFKRLCGVHRHTFDRMLEVLLQHEKLKKKKGRPAKHSVEDQLLIALQYWREYRTYFHIGVSWGLDESVVCRIVHRVESLLVETKEFHSLIKKWPREDGTQFEAAAGAAEGPIERAQEDGATILQERSAAHRSRGQLLIKRRAKGLS